MLDRFIATVAGSVALVTGLACSQSAPQDASLEAKWKDATLYDLPVRTLEGQDANLREHGGKVTLVVNVASRCGLTGQYAALEKIADKYRAQGFEVLAFPSGDFGGQEFAEASQIREFCSTRYGVSFPMYEKTRVKAGEGQSPVFECLGTKTGELPGWNFGKYLVSRDGKTAQFFSSSTAPDSARVIEAIEKALKEPVPAEFAETSTEKDAKAPAAEPAPAAPAAGTAPAGSGAN
ncbi:MAG: glutathione peroxidase [Phycisphaera sp.]|nr:glutathione peroxidase [Phycisphaera sp.]